MEYNKTNKPKLMEKPHFNMEKKFEVLMVMPMGVRVCVRFLFFVVQLLFLLLFAFVF